MPSNSDLPNHDATAEELAALYALGALETAERDQVRELIAQSPDFAQTVSDFSDTVADLPYALPCLPLGDSVKDRLFQKIAQDVIEEDSELYELLKLSIEELTQKSEALTWQTLAGSTADGQMAVLEVDEARQQVAFFVKATRGGTFPLHAHDSGETVLVMSGDFVVDGLKYRAGDRLESPANSAHQPETENGCLLLCISSLHDEILGE